MVTEILTHEMIDGGKDLLEELDSTGVLVNAALWFYFTDMEKWKLLISIPELAIEGPKAGYLAVQKVISRQREPSVSLDKISVIDPRSSLLELLGVMVRTGPGIGGVRFSGNVINGHLIEDAYIYRLIPSDGRPARSGARKAHSR